MTDWLMVIITAVYVVATIAICVANFKSAEASKEQLEESKRQFEITKMQAEHQLNEQKNQYEESIRIQCMPFLQMETRTGAFHDEHFSMEFNLCEEPTDTIVHYFKLKNLGNGPAINLVYSMKYNDNFNCDPMPICGIRAGDEYIFKIEFDINEESEILKPNVDFSYNDVLGNEYSQKITIVIDLNDGNIICENDEPKL